ASCVRTRADGIDTARARRPRSLRSAQASCRLRPAMAVLVQKFGGSSVADADKNMNVARRVAASAPGNQLVVVVSAMGKTTDGLLSLARQISTTPDLREMDMLLSTGEQVTIALVALALQSLGLKARSFTGPQVGMRDDPSHTPARIPQIHRDRGRRDPH